MNIKFQIKNRGNDGIEVEEEKSDDKISIAIEMAPTSPSPSGTLENPQ